MSIEELKRTNELLKELINVLIHAEKGYPSSFCLSDRDDLKRLRDKCEELNKEIDAKDLL